MSDTPVEGNPNLEQLRAKAARADELEKQLAERDRTETFSGLNIESGQGKMLADLYKPEGGYTREGFQEFAASYGVELESLSTNAAPPTPEPVPQGEAAPVATPEEQQHFQTQGMLSDNVINQETPDDPLREGWAEREQLLKDGAKPEKGDIAVLQGIFGAAANGDPNALYNQAEWRERNQ